MDKTKAKCVTIIIATLLGGMVYIMFAAESKLAYLFGAVFFAYGFISAGFDFYRWILAPAKEKKPVGTVKKAKAVEA